MELSTEQRESLREAMRRYQIYKDHQVFTCTQTDTQIVNKVRAELGLPVIELSCCPTALPETTYNEIYNLWIK